MVHRKSTYKLMFKNVKADTRKSIWQENSVFREQRRKDEMAHHSIDEEDGWCECDEESLESCEERKLDAPNEAGRQSSADEPDNFTALSPQQQQKEKSDKTVSKPLKNICKDPSNLHFRGVLKLSPSTGELDLIPALSQSSHKDNVRHRTTSCSRFSSSSGLDFVNIRPRTQTKYVPMRTNRSQKELLTSTTCIPRSRSSDAIFFKEHQHPFRSDKILLSSRRTPRTHGRKSNVCCSNCGKYL